jgi:hypothetical protein
MRPVLAITFLKEFAVRLTLIALILRAFLPVGWMPNPEGLGSGAAIVLCTSHGPVEAIIGPDGKPKEIPGPKGGHGDFCAHATCGSHFVPACAPALSAPYTEQAALHIARYEDWPTFAEHYRQQIPRGPPLLV